MQKKQTKTIKHKIAQTQRAAKNAAQTAAAFVLAAPILIMPIKVARKIGAWIGRNGARTPRARRIIEQNLDWVWPQLDAERRRGFPAKVGAQFGRLLVEYVKMATFSRERGARRCTGIDLLHEAQARGRGVIIASAHIGNWEAIRLAARDADVEVGIIYRAFNNGLFDRIAQKFIARAGAPVLHKGRRGMREMLAHLRAGGAILILVDQRTTRGEALPFLGRDALTATAIAGLARKLDAPLLPACALRDRTGSAFDIRFEPDIRKSTDIDTMRALNDRISTWIEDAPEQWFWLHHRWRGRKGRGFLGAENEPQARPR